MQTKEYMVALHKGVDYNQFWAEIENSSNGLENIPDRPVSIADNLDSLDRITHYFLTDTEAEKLRNDPRVIGVEIPAEHRDDIIISVNTVQANNFTKTNLSTGDYVNWGLIRNSNSTNIYGSGTTTTENYNYALDGSNIDVVIVDSGIQANHPEFQYLGNSTSRLNQYKWYPSLDPTTYYTDVDGHGTHVAGIATGKTYGWAKNSNIYSLKYSGLTMSQMANYIITWHNSKTVNPATGVKNPSVVNMSFGYALSLTTTYSIASANYRGNTISSPGYGPSSVYGLIFGQGRVPFWNATYNTPIVQMTDAGIIICKSAGNDSQKIDIPGGTDWNNLVTLTYQSNSAVAGTAYYMRGASPTSSSNSEKGNVIIVGALDSTTYSSTLDKKASYSQAGPGVDIFSSGSNVMSATSNTNLYSGQSYYWDANFKQVNINGTSQSTPQVAGAAALYLQAHPTATPAQVRSSLITVATTTMIGNISTNPTGNDYSNTVSQWGGNAGVAYQSIQGLIQVKTSGNTWQSPANVLIKTSANAWTNIKASWTKTAVGWVQTY
jgi:subtilisin family serine protease